MLTGDRSGSASDRIHPICPVNSASFGGNCKVACRPFRYHANDVQQMPKIVTKFTIKIFLDIFSEFSTNIAGNISGNLPTLINIGWSSLKFGSGKESGPIAKLYYLQQLQMQMK